MSVSGAAQPTEDAAEQDAADDHTADLATDQGHVDVAADLDDYAGPPDDYAASPDEYAASPDEYTQEEEHRPLSKLAVAALVTGLLALIPLALGFGIAALVSIRRTGKRGARMAAAGIYASWIWVLIAVAAVTLAHFSHGFRTQPTVQYRPAAAYSLQPGQCLDGHPQASRYRLVSCSGAHEAEVYGRFTLIGTAYPGAEQVRQQAISGCQPQLTTYVDPQLSQIGFGQEYVYPDQPAWAAGERTVICMARFAAGITGSIRKR